MVPGGWGGIILLWFHCELIKFFSWQYWVLMWGMWWGGWHKQTGLLGG